jgi:hypothetical protein
MLLLINQNIYKWRTTSRVWCVDFQHEGGVFIGVDGTSTDLERSVWHQVVVGRPAKRPPSTFSTDSGFSFSCRRVATKARAKPPKTLAGRASHPMGPLSLACVCLR